MVALIAVDTGGTFTDVVLIDAAGRRFRHKLLSTPDDPARAVLDGIRVVVEGAGGAEEARVVHGSTVATNALLEGKGADAAFVTTAGFEDTLHLGRQRRAQLYDLAPPPRPVPILRARCLGVAERVAWDGAVLTPLGEEALDDLVARLVALRPPAIAVSLLHSYANTEHEIMIGERLLRALPGVHLTLSHALLPELREYERGSTCAVNAVVAPCMDAYLGRLAEAIGEERLRIMGSAGGLMRAQEARRFPVHTVLSGPAGGVVGAMKLAAAAGRTRIITFDMGGTSTDVALCDGALALTAESTVAGLPVRVPVLDIHTVGAGGGSIARIDRGGALVVGPESAGADPGPAAYGRQDPSQPLATVTDAHVVLGHLRPDAFLGGAMRLDVEAATRAVQRVADDAGLALHAAAQGILRVADAAMLRAIQVISVQRGHDARDFVLVTFGGAGGLHACRLAAELGVRAVLVPTLPGLLSALGMALAPVVRTASRALMLTCPHDIDPLTLAPVTDALRALTDAASRALDDEGVPEEQRHLQLALDLRYQGQSWEITTPLGLTGERQIFDAFTARHEALYGTTFPGRPVEVVAARVRAEGLVPGASLPRAPLRSGELPQGFEEVTVHTPEGPTRWRLLDRALLEPGDTLAGPLIVTEYSSTTLVPPGWTLTVDPTLALLLTDAG